MLLFESASFGILAIFLTFVTVMAVVGVYVVIVWPLTFWDLAKLGLDRYGSWVNPILWSLFAGGSLAGFLCLSGAAFKRKQQVRAPAAPQFKR